MRFLDAPEKLEALPAWLRGFTLEEQKLAFLERILTGARGNRDEVESACRRRREEEPLWAELTEHLEQIAVVQQLIQDLHHPPRGCQVVKDMTELQPTRDEFKTQLAGLRAAFDEDLRGIETRLQAEQELLAKIEAATADLARRIAALDPGYRARKDKRFWTPAFWANLFNGQLIPLTETLLAEHVALQAQRQEALERIGKLETERKARLDQWASEHAAVMAASREASRQEILAKHEALNVALSHLDDQWQDLCRRLGIGALDKTSETLASARQAWMHAKQQSEDQCQFAQQWTKFVEETGPQLATRLPSFANVLAGTIGRLHTDAKFRDAAATPADIVLVEDADTLTDADVLNLARLGPRCVLVGQALTETAPPAPEKAARAPLAAIAWQRLWSALGGDAGAWPCTWLREDDRLLCQLMPLSADDRRHLESEGLADAPDIELGILHRPRTRPCLAQVTFSPTCSFADAFHFMMREVQEFPLEPLGRTCWWSEDAERIVRHFGPNAARSSDWIEIEPGVRLEAADATRIARIEFARPSGWDRVKAEAWLHRHRPVHDAERTVFLQTPYRYQLALGNLVQTVIRAGDWLPPGCAASLHDGRHFEFVSAPALQKPEWPRKGAGLELDLSASRHADRLPTGLRNGLPMRGFVNYLEAQALIRRLETFMHKDVNGHPCVISVLALYEGQVELLRRLMAQSEILAHRARSRGGIAAEPAASARVRRGFLEPDAQPRPSRRGLRRRRA